MALGANFYVDFRFGGTGYKSVATVAGNGCLIILGMDSFFHLFHLSMIITCIFLFSSALLMEPQTANLVYHVVSVFASIFYINFIFFDILTNS